jgi:hypothetical protein
MVSIPFCSLAGKGLGNHLIVHPFVNTDILTTGAPDFMLVHLAVVHLFDAVFMTAKHCAGTDFIIAPEFFFAGGTVNCQHGIMVTLPSAIFSDVSVPVPADQKILPVVPFCFAEILVES